MRTLLRVCGWLTLAFVVLVSGAYLAHGVHATIEVSHAKKEAAADVDAALPGAQRSAVRERDAVRALTSARWGEPDYAWQELRCTLETVDAGWIVQHYTQECQIRSVDLFASRGSDGDCAFSTLGDEFPDARPTDGLRWVEVRRGPTTALSTEQSALAGCPDDLLQPSAYGASRLLDGARPTDLDQSPHWTIVTTSTEVSASALGCNPWTVLFCTAPIDDPVLGDDVLG